MPPPPLPAQDTPVAFTARTGAPLAGILVCGMFGFIACIVGFVMLLGIQESVGMRDTGQPWYVGFYPLCTGLLLAGFGIGGALQLHVRRHPVLVITSHGLEFYLQGGPHLVGLPRLMQLGVQMLTPASYRLKRLDIPWNQITDVGVQGVPLMRSLVVVNNGIPQTFPQDLFANSVDAIAHEILRRRRR